MLSLDQLPAGMSRINITTNQQHVLGADNQKQKNKELFDFLGLSLINCIFGNISFIS